MDLLFRLSKDKVEGFENEVKTKNFFNKMCFFDDMSSILMDRMDIDKVDKAYTETNSKIDKYLMTFDDSFSSFTTSNEYFELLRDWMKYYKLMTEDIARHLNDLDYPLYHNLFHYCTATFHPTYLSELYLRVLKKELS